VRIISFAHTTPALLAGRKTVTRRDWDDDYAARFRAGEVVKAYDRSPRFKGKWVATVQLVADPVLESTALMPDSDFESEGFAWMEENGHRLWGRTPREHWDLWRQEPNTMWVVRFRLVGRS